jgi:hypothetical protein
MTVVPGWVGFGLLCLGSPQGAEVMNASLVGWPTFKNSNRIASIVCTHRHHNYSTIEPIPRLHQDTISVWDSSNGEDFNVCKEKDWEEPITIQFKSGSSFSLYS